ncbi:SDR family NAD(P)-dependent oxidoreductase [Arcanobacterium bovis]|uniref:SDR family NAD(P)-dependent oxidoreductase n=1 Tax=Arcanobacterium bovis TaxID=2529275 RepID=A0A4Q9V194_9ACTO|nr:SDR family NAD(P)-dependent oxidoreductase [Arcanobacterium bovis]TBW21431.1 SDR family NAD(P)-dependent oxidoreductase [Arcanobacterium bovis]
MGRALITGASSGLGREFAWTLAAEGNDLVLVARNRDRLEELADELRQKANIGVEVLPADLNSAEGVDTVAQRIQSVNQPITLLINNAGMGLGQDFVGGDITRELGAVNVMVNAVLVLTHAAVNTMVARGRGTIINVSSITSMTVQGTYSAHKAWVKVFTEGLATELEGTGVNITAVMPGLMHTEFHERVNVDAGQWQEFMFMDPQLVTNVALDAARRGQVIVVPTPMYKFTYGLLKFAPRALVRKFAGPKMSGRL